MTYSLDRWRADLNAHAAAFAALFKQNRTLSPSYGITATALLWCIREPDRHPVLDTIPPLDDPQRDLLRDAIRDWVDFEPPIAAKNLHRKSQSDLALQAALDTLLIFFKDDVLRLRLLQPDSRRDIQVSGDVTGANVVIDGVQYVAGDLIIHYIKPKAQRLCPKPPAPPHHFGGRDTELNALIQQLKDSVGEKIAITAVSGLGGIGKTTLARAIAHHMHADKTFRAVLWANVTRAPNVTSIISDWVVKHADSSFDVSAYHDPEQIAAAAHKLLDDVINEQCEDCEPPRVLVVLDDVWDNGLDTARLLAEHACPTHATVLITSRSEQLAANLHATSTRLDRMTPDDAAKMLADYLHGADTANLRALGAVLDGHALALELASRRVEIAAGRPGATLNTALTALTAQYRTGIADGTPFKDLHLAPGEQREDNLTLALSYSYDDLQPDDRTRFRALGVLAFDAPFDAALLAALWDVDAANVDDHADKLRLLSLIETDGDAYRQHPLLRSYARALLTDHGELDAAFNRYADHVIEQAEQFDTLQLEQWHTLDPLLPHVEAVGDELTARWEALTPSAPPDGGVIQRCGDFAWNVTRYVNYRRQMIETANGRTLRGLNWLETGLAVYRAQGDQSREATTLTNIGSVWDALGEKRKALAFYEQALPLRRAVGDRGGEATTLNNMAAIYFHEGDLEKAAQTFEQIIEVVRDIGAVAEEASVHLNIAVVLQRMNRIDEAITHAEQGRAILVKYDLPQNAGGSTLAHYDELLAELRGGGEA